MLGIRARGCYGRRLALDFRILGPLEARDGDDVLRLGGERQRGVLALLLLHANEVVSSDRLIDELWGEHPPEDAATALQAHVSRLRKALPGGAEVIVTRAPGYVVRVEPNALDLHRFEAMVDAGQAALRDGDAERAGQQLRDALALWRGRPFADLENEPFVREATVRLDESWLEAVESRIEADLALGRHSELVAELHALARAHPLRERLRRQLMLALYRSGRQAEALDVYADARRRLVDDLGLEPGPELQRLQVAILEHDPELELTALARPRLARVPRRWVAVGAGMAVATGAVVAWTVTSAADAPPRTTGGGALVALEAASGEIRHRFAIGSTPAAVAAGEDAIWLVDADARTVVHVDPSSGETVTFATGATPTDIATTRDALWVANGRRLPSAQFVGPVATAVVRLDPESRTERAEVALPLKGGALSNLVENHLAVSDNAVWAIAPDFSVARIDPRSNTVTARSTAVPAAAVSAAGTSVWVLGVHGTVVRLDEQTGRPVERVQVPAGPLDAIAAGDGAAWVTSPQDGTIWRIGAGSQPSVGSTQVGFGVSDVAVAPGGVWIANPIQGTVTKLDPESATVVGTTDVGGIPRALTVRGGLVWVATTGPGSCERVLYGGDGKPELLVTSELPLQGGVRITALQMAQAIAFVLRERGFRAGKFRVGYQSCDHSIARTGLFDEPKCAANARVHAKNPDVVGVIGTLNSPCAFAALPFLNRAPGGPLAMVSPLNSFVGLTRAGPGVDASVVASLYPTGTRSFVRVNPTDDLQGAALALVARDLGRTRVFALDDGDPGYGRMMADAFVASARRTGLTVAGRAAWDPGARDYDELAARVGMSGATAVFLGGLLDTNGAAVVRALRARLGNDVAVLVTDGFTPVPVFVKRGGDAAKGTYVSLAGIVTERLPPAGRRFVERFSQTLPGAEIEPSAVYAAQAAEVLLDAIARSDGTRASVLEQLFRTKVNDGLLGRFSFDANGDITESPVTILRVERGGAANTILSVEGAVVDRVVRPSPMLVAGAP